MNRSTALSKALLVTALLCVLGLPGAARGQEIPSPYDYIETAHAVGVFGGILSPGTGQLDLGPDQGIVAGARYAVELTGPVSLEAVGRVLTSERDVRDPARAEGERVVGTADVLLTSADVRLKFSLPGRRTWHGIAPYLWAGGGVAFDLAGEPEADQAIVDRANRFDFGTSFLGLLGLGVRWIPRDDLEFRVDGEFDLWQLDTPPGYLAEDNADLFETPPPEDEWVSAMGLTIGAAFRW